MLPQVSVEQSFIRNTFIGFMPWLYVRCDLEKATLKRLFLKRQVQSSQYQGVCQTKMYMGPELKTCIQVSQARKTMLYPSGTSFHVDNFSIQDLSDFWPQKRLFLVFFQRKLHAFENAEVVTVKLCCIRDFYVLSYLIHPNATFRLGSH